MSSLTYDPLPEIELTKETYEFLNKNSILERLQELHEKRCPANKVSRIDTLDVRVFKFCQRD